MKLLRYILFLIITILFSCEKVVLIDCEKCFIDEPVDALLTIKISNNNSSLSDLTIYEGDLEDNIIYSIENAYPGEITVRVPINKKYTASVTYNLITGAYTAVDSALPRVKFSKDQCDDPCYYIYDNTLNLKLKYQ